MQTIEIPGTNGTVILQYQVETSGVVLLVNGPGLVGSTGTVCYPQTYLGVPGFALFIGPLQQAENALGPYLPV